MYRDCDDEGALLKVSDCSEQLARRPHPGGACLQSLCPAAGSPCKCKDMPDLPKQLPLPGCSVSDRSLSMFKGPTYIGAGPRI